MATITSGYALNPQGGWRTFDSGCPLLAGEVAFDHEPTAADIANTFPTVAAAMQRQAAYPVAVAAGLTVTSTGTPAVDGVYALDPNSISNISYEAQHISTFSAFTNGTTTGMVWPLANGTFVTFPNTTVFLNFAKAAAQFMSQLKQYTVGVSGVAAPSAAITIP